MVPSTSLTSCSTPLAAGRQRARCCRRSTAINCVVRERHAGHAARRTYVYTARGDARQCRTRGPRGQCSQTVGKTPPFPSITSSPPRRLRARAYERPRDCPGSIVPKNNTGRALETHTHIFTSSVTHIIVKVISELILLFLFQRIAEMPFLRIMKAIYHVK